MEKPTKTKQRRGFACMDPEKQREIARAGGKKSQESGRGHRFTQEEAREAGRKGGSVIGKDRAHMSKIGRKGGMKRTQDTTQ